MHIAGFPKEIDLKEMFPSPNFSKKGMRPSKIKLVKWVLSYKAKETLVSEGRSNLYLFAQFKERPALYMHMEKTTILD